MSLRIEGPAEWALVLVFVLVLIVLMDIPEILDGLL